MRSSALILLAGFVITSPTQAVDLYKSPTGHFNGQCDKSDIFGWKFADKFADKVCYVLKGYDPGKFFDASGFPIPDSYKSPTCDPRTVTQAQKDILSSAYRRAPYYVRDKLCRLTRLFLTEESDSSAFWVPSDLSAKADVFIFLSDSALNGSLADGENKILDNLFQKGGNLPRFETPDRGPELNVLAVLAHELGHALLADSNADETNARRYLRGRRPRPSPNPSSACFDHAFLGHPWQKKAFHDHIRRWVKFGDANYNSPQPPIASRIMDLYDKRDFVSVFAAWSPEEDFIETYKIRVLKDSLAALGIKFSSGETIDVLFLPDSSVLRRKFDCLHSLGLTPGVWW